jgi:hypothetical protein
MNLWRRHLNHTQAATDAENSEPLGTASGNIKGYSHYGKQFGSSSKILKD